MNSDPFKLVTERRFQELRDEAHRHRLVKEAGIGADPRRRGAVATLIATILSVVQRKRHGASGLLRGHDAAGFTGTNNPTAEVDVEAHGQVSLDAVRARTGWGAGLR